MHVILKGSFDVKPWLREVVFKVSMKDKINELPGLIGFLLECSALRRAEVSLYRGHLCIEKRNRNYRDCLQGAGREIG